MFTHFRFRTKIVKSLNLFDFATKLTQKQHKGALRIDATCSERIQ